MLHRPKRKMRQNSPNNRHNIANGGSVLLTYTNESLAIRYPHSHLENCQYWKCFGKN